MNKLVSVTLTVAMLVIVFMAVYFLKIYIHDIAALNQCVNNAGICATNSQ